MAETTPGPWAVCGEPPNDSWYEGITIFCPAEGTRVADAAVLNPRHREDARLIAAAPETAAERDRLKESNAELLAVLFQAQAILNPMSGFLKRAAGKRQVHIEAVRDQIRDATDDAADEAIKRAAT